MLDYQTPELQEIEVRNEETMLFLSYPVYRTLLLQPDLRQQPNVKYFQMNV